MASREMYDVLQKLKELDSKNPNVHNDALENTLKMNGLKEKIDETITISADSPEDLPVIAQIMKLAGMKAVTPDMMPDKDNEPVMKQDDDINGSPCGSEEPEEGFDNEPNPEYKEYDPSFAKDAGHSARKVRQVPAMSGDNPLESAEDKLRAEYETFKEELWNKLSDGKESTDEGRGRGKLMAGRGRGKIMAGRGRGKMPKEDVKTTEGRGRGKGKKK